ncbi:MAG: PIN domain-containing protein [Candidatus Micrarchaeota archaeon]
MKLVVDANILLSALLRKGLTQRLWFHPSLRLSAPEFLLVEARAHIEEMRQKYGGTQDELMRVFSLLEKQLTLVQDEKLLPFLPAASTLTKDRKDLLYLACALYEDAALWTHDKGFKSQRRIKIYSTLELGEEIGSL